MAFSAFTVLYEHHVEFQEERLFLKLDECLFSFFLNDEETRKREKEKDDMQIITVLRKLSQVPGSEAHTCRLELILHRGADRACNGPGTC